MKKPGETDKCPHCKKTLEKIPARKTKCPFCGNYMFSRTRPADRKKVLVTEEQKEKIEDQWEEYLGDGELSNRARERDEFRAIKKELTEQFGKEPSKNDIKWSILNKRLTECVSKRNWGLYRNEKFNMSELLYKEGQIEQSLTTLFEVFFLDVNGANNLGGLDEKSMSQEKMEEYGIKEFDPSDAFIAPGIVKRIQKIISKLRPTKKQVKELFISTNKNKKPMKKMPISEEKAWRKLKKEINF